MYRRVDRLGNSKILQSNCNQKKRTEKAHAAPQIRYSGPVTSSQEYGWDHVPLMKRYDDKPDYPFDVSGRTKTITAITRNGYIKR